MAYIDTTNMPLHMPVPGTKEPAQIALLNENCVVIDAHDHTTGKGLAIGRLRSGLEANRPAAGSAGNVYFATDTGRFYVDTGTAWVQFITEGGQATVTGWTLIDPVVRDTIQWGPEGSGTIDTTLTRSSAGNLKFSGPQARLWFQAPDAVAGARSLLSTNDAGLLRWTVDLGNGDALTGGNAGARFVLTPWDDAGSALPAVVVIDRARRDINLGGNVGVGVAPAAWDAGFRAVQVGAGTALWGATGSPGFYLSSNTYYDGTARKASITGVGGELALESGNLVYKTAPSVAAGAAQTFTTRLTVDQNGATSINAASGVPVLALRASALHTWASTYPALEMGLAGNIVAPTDSYGLFLNCNTYHDGTGWKAQASTAAAQLQVQAGNVIVYTDTGAGAGAPQTFKERLRINSLGTLTLTPDAGQNALVIPNTGGASAFVVQNGSGNNMRIAAANAGEFLELYAAGGATIPFVDNAQALGQPSTRWTALHAVNGTIQTSHVSQKKDFARLDPAACVAAVTETDWLSFSYIDPVIPERQEGMSDEAWAQQQEQHQKMVAETADSRKQRGFVLGSEEYHTADLFGQADRRSASTGSDLAVVACALQSALHRIAELEAKVGNAPAA